MFRPRPTEYWSKSFEVKAMPPTVSQGIRTHRRAYCQLRLGLCGRRTCTTFEQAAHSIRHSLSLLLLHPLVIGTDENSQAAANIHCSLTRSVLGVCPKCAAHTEGTRVRAAPRPFFCASIDHIVAERLGHPGVDMKKAEESASILHRSSGRWTASTYRTLAFKTRTLKPARDQARQARR